MLNLFDGYYAGYFSSANDNAVALLILNDGAVSGTDGSTHYDGEYRIDEENQLIDAEIDVLVRANTMTIQGKSSGSSGLSCKIRMTMPFNFAEKSFIPMMTDFGPVNARFEKVRELRRAIRLTVQL